MPDFYFAASDAAGLEAVFRAIAQESGGSSIQLDDEAFVKDVMAVSYTHLDVYKRQCEACIRTT